MAEIPPKWDGTVPNWALSGYIGAEKDFSEWLYSVVFWDMWDGQFETLSDAEAMARAEAIARTKVLERTFALYDTLDQAKAWQLMHAHQNGWYRLTPSEPSSILEFLQNMLEGVQPGSSQAVDLGFAISTLVPALVQMGVDGEKLIAVPTRWSKTRVAIPSLRKALDEQRGDELEDTVHTILDGIADDNIPVREFREKLRTKTYRQTTPQVVGEVYLLPEGDLLLLKTTSAAQRRAVEMALKGVVGDWSVKDGFQLVRELASRFMRKEPVSR